MTASGSPGNRPGSRPVLALALLLAAATAAGGEPATAPRLSALSLSGYLDEDDNWSAEVGLDAAVGARFNAFGTLGESAVSLPPTPLGGASRDLEFAYGSLGLGYAQGRFSSDLSLSFWGDDATVATRDLRAGIGYDGPRGGIRLTGAYRDLDFTVRRLVPDVGLVTEKRSATGTGVGLELSYLPTDSWRLYAGGERSDYEDRLEQLAARIPLRLLGQRQLMQSSTFPEWSWHAGTDLFLGAHRVNLEYSAERSIFGGLDSSATSLAWLLPLGAADRWALDLRVGVAEAETGSGATFGLATLAFLY